MAAITSGVELVQKLKESGTGEAKLNVAREVLYKYGRAATAAQVVEALEQSDIVPLMTRSKARAFMETGEFSPETLNVKPVAIEDQLAGVVTRVGPPAQPVDAIDPKSVSTIGPEKAEKSDLTPELPQKSPVAKK